MIATHSILLRCATGIAASLAALAPACRTISENEIERGFVAREPIEATRAAPPRPGWSEWRGEHRDGVVAGITLPDVLPLAPWPEAWRVPVGAGLSGVILDESRAYVHSRRGDQEVVSAVDARTGAPIWERTNAIEDWKQGIGAGHIPTGPLATPTLAHGRLFTLGVWGLVQCLDATTGEVLWSRSPRELTGTESHIEYGHAASPLVRDGRVIVVLDASGAEPSRRGSIVALSAEDGSILWRALPETAAYVSPVQATLAGTTQIVARSWERIVGLDPNDGAILWEEPALAEGMTRDCATPLVVGDWIFVTNSAHGTIALEVRHGPSSLDGAWSALRAYRTGWLAGKIASPIWADGRVVGLHRSGYLAAIDAATGDPAWKIRKFGEYASFIVVGSRTFALDERGRLALIRFEDAGPVFEREWRIGESTWAHPAIDAHGIYFRDGEDLVHLAFAAGSPDPSSLRRSP